MTRGRLTFFFAALTALAIAVSGCGSSSDSSGAGKDAAAPSPATAATGATGKSAGDKAATSKPKTGTKSQSADGETSTDSHAASKEFADKSKAPKFGSAADEKQVKKTVAAIAAATADGDAAKLCNVLYAKSYVEQLQAQGGCIPTTGKAIQPFGKYTIKVKDMQFITDSDVEVFGKSTFKYNDVTKNAEPILNFKLENGKWKFYVRTQ